MFWGGIMHTYDEKSPRHRAWECLRAHHHVRCRGIKVHEEHSIYSTLDEYHPLLKNNVLFYTRGIREI